MTALLALHANQTDPDIRLAWPDGTGALRNFTGWALTVKVLNPLTNTTVLTKSTGVTGGNGTGLSNVVISWTAAELAQLDGPTVWALKVEAVSGLDVAVFTVDLRGTLPRFHVIPEPT